MRVVIIQNQTQFGKYINSHQLPDDTLICIDPVSKLLADEKKIKNYFYNELLEETQIKSRINDFEFRLEELVKLLNQYSEQRYQKFTINIGSYFKFGLHQLIGQIWYNFYIIETIVNKFPGKELVIFSGKELRLFYEFRPNPDSLFSIVFINSKFSQNKHKIIYVEQLSNQKFSIKFLLKKFLSSKLINLVRNTNYKLSSIKYIFTKRKKLLLVGGEYEWKILSKLERFKKKWQLNYMSFPRKLNSNVEDRKILELLNASISIDNAPLYPLDIYANLMSASQLNYEKNYFKYKNLIKKYDGIVASVFVEPEHNYIAHIANQLSKKVIVWQHGEQGLWADKTSDFSEVMFANYYLYYGKQTKEKYKPYKENGVLEELVEVGSLKSKVKIKNKKNIIYVTAKWLKNICPFDDMVNADNSLLRSQRVLIPYLEKLSKKNDVIIKKNNTADKNYNELVINPENNIVEDSKSFLDLISDAKLVIIDSPSTTSLEASSTNVPMFVINGRVRLNPVALNLLKKRAVVRDTPEELVIEINKFLNNGFYDAELNNNEYCLAYSSIMNQKEVEANVLSFLEQKL